MIKYPSCKYLHECFIDNGNGVLSWKVRPRSHFQEDRTCGVFNSQFSGKEAGWKREAKNGKDIRVRINISGYGIFYRYKIVWSMNTGNFPEKSIQIDHKDGNPLNDSFENLRLVNQSQNNMNSRSRTKKYTKLKGAYYDKFHDKWISYIKVNGKSIFLGSFRDDLSAHEAYSIASRIHFGEFSNDGTGS